MHDKIVKKNIFHNMKFGIEGHKRSFLCLKRNFVLDIFFAQNQIYPKLFQIDSILKH